MTMLGRHLSTMQDHVDYLLGQMKEGSTCAVVLSDGTTHRVNPDMSLVQFARVCDGLRADYGEAVDYKVLHKHALQALNEANKEVSRLQGVQERLSNIQAEVARHKENATFWETMAYKGEIRALKAELRLAKSQNKR